MIPHNEIRAKYGAMALEEYIAMSVVMKLPRVPFSTKREVDQHWEEIGTKTVRNAIKEIAPECLLNIDFTVEIARRLFTSAAKRHVCSENVVMTYAAEYFWTRDKVDFSNCKAEFWTYLYDVMVARTKEINVAHISELVESDAGMDDAEVLKSAIYQLMHDVKTYMDSVLGEFSNTPFGETILSLDLEQFVGWSGLPADRITRNYLGVRTLVDTNRYSHRNYPVREIKMTVPGHRTVASLEAACDAGADMVIAGITFPAPYISKLADEAGTVYRTHQFAELTNQAAASLEAMASYTLGDLSMENRHQAANKHVVTPIPAATMERLLDEANATRYDFNGHPLVDQVAQAIKSKDIGLYVNKVAIKVTGTAVAHLSDLDALASFLTNFTQESVNTLKETLVADVEREIEAPVQDDLAAARLKGSIDNLSKISTCLTTLVELQSTIKDILVAKLGQ